MNAGATRKLFGAGSVLVGMLLPQALLACAACFGRSDDAMAHGMNMGIFTLLIVIVSVLAGIASIGFYFVRRAARVAAESATLAGGSQPAPLQQPISQQTP